MEKKQRVTRFCPFFTLSTRHASPSPSNASVLFSLPLIETSARCIYCTVVVVHEQETCRSAAARLLNPTDVSAALIWILRL